MSTYQDGTAKVVVLGQGSKGVLRDAMGEWSAPWNRGRRGEGPLLPMKNLVCPPMV